MMVCGYASRAWELGPPGGQLGASKAANGRTGTVSDLLQIAGLIMPFLKEFAQESGPTWQVPQECFQSN